MGRRRECGSAQSRRIAHRFGAAATETVLVMPFLVVVLALLLFFGRGMVRVQRAAVMDRYEGWRQLSARPIDDPVPREIWVDNTTRTDDLNRMFFAGRASSIDDLSAALRSRFEVDHDEPIELWRRLDGSIRHSHERRFREARYVHSWRYVPDRRWRESSDDEWEMGDPSWPSHGDWAPAGSIRSNVRAIRDEFFQSFDDPVSERATADLPGSGFAFLLRPLYLAVPAYVGPSFGFE